MNSLEQKVLFFLQVKFPDLTVINFNRESLFHYKRRIARYKGKGFIAISPPFQYEGRTMYNDFALHLPDGRSMTIECKERTNTVDYTYIHEKVKKTKDIVEDVIIFILEGQGFSNHFTIKSFEHAKSKIIFSLNDLQIV